MMVEYDDVPESVTSASMVLGQNRIQNVPISPLNVQANGNLAPRNGGNVQGSMNAAAPAQQTNSGGATGLMGQASQAQTTAGNALQNASDKVSGAQQKVSDQKQKWGGILNQIKGVGTTKPQ